MKPRYFLYFIAIHLLTMASHPPLWGQMESPTKGRWMDFPGEREAFLEVEDNPSLNLKSQMTIELWVYPRRLPQVPQPRWQLVKKGDAYNLAIWSAGIPGQILLEMNRTIFIIQDGFEIGTWNHIGGAYDKEKGETWFYVNGKVHLVEGVAPQALESKSSLQVGQQFDGGMDALRISRNVRYQADYDPPLKHFETDRHTVLLWHFENKKDDSKNENQFEVRGEGIRFLGTPFRSVEAANKLAVTWGRIKHP